MEDELQDFPIYPAIPARPPRHFFSVSAGLFFIMENQQWKPVSDAPVGVPMWLHQEGRAIWIGGKDAVDYETWLWGNCYDNYWHDGAEWKGDIECDDDYQPTLFMLLPQPPNSTES